MLEEFKVENFEEARGLADAIQTNGDNIRDIFEDLDNVMKDLYGNNWTLSIGSEDAHERYNELRRSYEVFYNDITNMKAHVYEVTETSEAADVSFGQDISNVG